MVMVTVMAICMVMVLVIAAWLCHVMLYARVCLSHCNKLADNLNARARASKMRKGNATIHTTFGQCAVQVMPTAGALVHDQRKP